MAGIKALGAGRAGYDRRKALSENAKYCAKGLTKLGL